MLISQNTTWSKANSPYVLKDFIFVRNDATLTIEAGVTIYGEEGNPDEGVAPTLIITNGSKINAVGTADEPIVFTSILAKTQTLSQNDKGFGVDLFYSVMHPSMEKQSTEMQKPLPRLKEYLMHI